MDARAWREDGTRFQKRSRRRILQQTLPWGASRKGGTAHSQSGYFARSPEVSRRARIGARNPFVSIGIPTADHRFYPPAPVVPFQGNTGSEIGLAGGLGRGLDEDDGVALGRIRVAGTAEEKLACHCL